MYSTQCNTNMVKTYNCSCNRNMYLWWCNNVYKRLQSFIWRYVYCAFLGFCFGIDSNVLPGVGKFGCIWLDWFAHGQGIWLQIFEKSQIPTLRSASPPPPRQHYIDRWISIEIFKLSEMQSKSALLLGLHNNLFIASKTLLFSSPLLMTWFPME